MNSSTSNGYRWVAEWERHEATWIAWPHNRKTWPGLFDAIPKVTEAMIRILAEVEHVHVVGGPSESYEIAKKRLSGIANVSVHDIRSNDCWIRDYGPTFLVSQDQKNLGAVRWRFNAWGEKYRPYDDDAAAGDLICQRLSSKGSIRNDSAESMAVFPSRLIGEGGGLETDGQGTLMTTSSCLLAPTRNPNWTREQVERELQQMLGVTKILWVDGGALEGDDTDSHIDQLARFVRPGVVLSAVSHSGDDSNAPKLASQFRLLESMTDASNNALEIIPIVTPPPRRIQGKRVPESYCNFYLANGIVLVPTFGFQETDEAAAKLLGELFPDRRVIPLDASDFIWGLGAFHCATQQQPAVG